MIYLDASALVTLLSGRQYATELRAFLARTPGTPMATGGCRTLDAVHVASAQELGENLTVLVSYDRRMLTVAETLGLPTAAPGLPGVGG